MLKKIRHPIINQCKRLDDKYCLIIKLDGIGEKYIHGMLDDCWNSSETSFVNLTDLFGKKHSIPTSNIDTIRHGFSKWNLYFHNKAELESVSLGEYKGCACLPDEIELEFDSMYGGLWSDFSEHCRLVILTNNLI
nr:hypothetical protein [Moritella viscosa]